MGQVNIEQWEDRAKQLLQDRTFQLAVVTFLAALIPRLMFMEHGLWQDEGREMSYARNLLQGEGLHNRGSPPGQHPPGFYLMLAKAFLLFGANDTVGMAMVATMGALTAAIAFLIGDELYNKYAGIAAGAFVIFLPTQFFISIRVLNDGPMTFFMMLAAYLFIKSERADNAYIFYGATGATAIAAMTKLPALVLIPVFGFYAFYRRGWDTLRVRRYQIGVAAAGSVFLVWEAYNLMTTGTSVAWEMGHRAFFEHGDGGGGGRRDKSTWYYIWNMAGILTMPAFLGFMAGSVTTFLYDTKSRIDAFTSRTRYLAIAIVVLGAIGGFATQPFMKGVSVLVFLVALLLVLFYVETDTAFVLVYLLAVFEMMTLKTVNLPRYFLPFMPMAAVLAGYGTDKVRAAVASITNPSAGKLTFAAVVVGAVYLMSGPAIAQVESSSQGYAGLDEAGAWMSDRVEGDEIIVAASPNQITWYADHDNVESLSRYHSAEELDTFVEENNVRYVEWDLWEPQMHTKVQYAPQHLEQSDRYRRVGTFGPAQQMQNGAQIPSVMVYEVQNGDG